MRFTTKCFLKSTVPPLAFNGTLNLTIQNTQYKGFPFEWSNKNRKHIHKKADCISGKRTISFLTEQYIYYILMSKGKEWKVKAHKYKIKVKKLFDFLVFSNRGETNRLIARTKNSIVRIFLIKTINRSRKVEGNLWSNFGRRYSGEFFDAAKDEFVIFFDQSWFVKKIFVDFLLNTRCLHFGYDKFRAMYQAAPFGIRSLHSNNSQ